MAETTKSPVEVGRTAAWAWWLLALLAGLALVIGFRVSRPKPASKPTPVAFTVHLTCCGGKSVDDKTVYVPNGTANLVITIPPTGNGYSSEWIRVPENVRDSWYRTSGRVAFLFPNGTEKETNQLVKKSVQEPGALAFKLKNPGEKEVKVEIGLTY